MEQILKNMALHMLIEFCLEHGIDCSGTYVTKNGRGFTYSLVDDATGTIEIASITFHKSQVPTFRYPTPLPYSGPITRHLGPVPLSIGKTYERPALEFTEDVDTRQQRWADNYLADRSSH